MNSAKAALDQMAQDYPKATMLMEYIYKHYPDDKEKFVNIKMLPHILSDNTHSNTELEEIIDKLAIFNGFTKWGPLPY